MPDFAYCTSADVEAILSPDGVTLHAEDDGVDQNTPDAVANIDAMIDWASSTIDFFLSERYAGEDLANSRWVRRVCAVLAACRVMTRRGDPGPLAIMNECQELTSLQPSGPLEMIRRGFADVPGDLPTKIDLTPALTNYRLDSRYRSHKARVQPTHSTGGPSKLPRFEDPRDRSSVDR